MYKYKSESTILFAFRISVMDCGSAADFYWFGQYRVALRSLGLNCTDQITSCSLHAEARLVQPRMAPDLVDCWSLRGIVAK